MAKFYPSNRIKRLRVRATVIAAKDVPCADCHKRFPHWIMEFDHVPKRGEKLFKISSAASCASWKRLAAELAKCDVVCANCHRDRTYKRRSQ